MPIARSSSVTPQVETPVSQPQNVEPQTTISHEWAGIPIDLFRHFNIDFSKIPNKETDKLREIHAWAKDKAGNEATIGDVLLKISSIESQLGAPALNEKRYDRVWNWIALTRRMEDLDKRRESLRKKWAV